MYLVSVLLMGALPYHIFKSLKNYAFLLFAVPLVGLGLYVMDDTSTNVMFYQGLEIMAMASSILTFVLSYKTKDLMRLSYYFLFLNAPAVFFFKDKYLFGAYFVMMFLSAISLYVIAIYYKKTFQSTSIDTIRGIVLKAPKLGLFLRLSLMSLGLFPPFANFFVFMANILKYNLSAIDYTIGFWLFMANFFMAFRIMSKTLFGKPNDLVSYKDFGAGFSLGFGALFLTLSVFGFYALVYVLNI